MINLKNIKDAGFAGAATPADAGAPISGGKGKGQILGGGKRTIVTAPALPLTNIVAAFDARDTTTLFTDAGKTTAAGQDDEVYVWADISGNGNDLTQTTQAYRPLYDLANSRVYFDGVPAAAESVNMVLPDLSSLTSITVAARLQVNIGSENASVWGFTSVVKSTSYPYWAFSGTGHYTIGPAGINRMQVDDWATIGVSPWAEVTYEEWTDPSGNAKVYVNGVEHGSVVVGTYGVRTDPRIGCGIRSGTGQFSIDGYFTRLAIYQTYDMSTEARAALKSWLEYTP
jgi:hypothetical protein